MKYNKILEVSEDEDRVYFSFYIDNNTPKIFGLPKETCANKAIYVGTSFSSLTMVETDKVKYLFSDLMTKAMMTHPATRLCSKETLKMIS